MNTAELLKYRQEQEARKGAVEAWIKRSEARRFTGDTPTGYDALIGLPTLAEKLAAKREEYDEDARGEALWHMRNPGGER